MGIGAKTFLRRQLLDVLLPERFYLRVDGHCPCCEADVRFIAYDAWLRDHFQCTRCRSIPRNRALFHALDTHFPGWRTLRIHESSPSAGGASAQLRAACPGYVSTHFHPGAPPGAMIDGHRNENLGAQTFDDESFDLVISQDVLEHVYEADDVFREIARTLRPGGAHVFTVPLLNKHRPTDVWATLGEDGEPRFVAEPEYHGNPIDARGSPVTMHWGYDIVDHIRSACQLETVIESIDDLRLGIRAEYNEVLITRKPRALAPA